MARMAIDAVAHAPYGPPPSIMIPKSGYRFSEEIMLKIETRRQAQGLALQVLTHAAHRFGRPERDPSGT